MGSYRQDTRQLHVGCYGYLSDAFAAPWIQLDPYLRLEHTRTSLPEGMHIRSGRVAPAFEQPGGGTQHLCEKQIYVGDTCVGVEPVSVAELIARGIVKPLADHGGRQAEE